MSSLLLSGALDHCVSTLSLRPRSAQISLADRHMVVALTPMAGRQLPWLAAAWLLLELRAQLPVQYLRALGQLPQRPQAHLPRSRRSQAPAAQVVLVAVELAATLRLVAMSPYLSHRWYSPQQLKTVRPPLQPALGKVRKLLSVTASWSA